MVSHSLEPSGTTQLQRYNGTTQHNGHHQARQGRALRANAPGHSCMAHQVSKLDGRAGAGKMPLEAQRAKSKPPGVRWHSLDWYYLT